MVFRLNRLFLSLLIALSACAAAQRGVPAPEQVPLVAAPVQGRHAITDLPLFEAGPSDGQHRGYFSAAGAREVSLRFMAHGHMAYRVVAVCDARARIQRRDEGIGGSVWVAAGVPITLRVPPGERLRSGLELDPATQACDLTVTPGGRPGWTLRLEREDTALPVIAALDAPVRSCTGGGADALERAFMDSGDLAATCPMSAGPVTMLADGADALNARVEALTGSRLPRAALIAGDPAVALDYSNAPDLDLIYVNYLNMNADFAGYLTARMLAWHAARGTVVRILVSDVMLTETDRRLFEGLASQYPTVQVQPYRMPAEAARGVEGQFARLHRVTHVKLFATIARQPGRSIAIVGGRNIHEGYFFPEPRDLDDFPFLHQYDPEQMRLTGGFTAYEDFELALQGDAQVREIVQQMGALWNRDRDTQAMWPTPHRAETVRALPDHAMRHLISVPYTDGAALDRYYAGLIDAAQHRIRIASPYLNLTPAISAAMERAHARGVTVDVVATVRVREATDFMVTGLNRRFANRHGDWVRFFDYDPMPLLLHSKLIVIDDRLVLIGSVNLNQRSFWHDLENGVAILDAALAARADRLIQSYIDQGERVLPGQELSPWMRFFSRLGFIERGF
ncbi:phospholipase D-like domain-containing protein [Pararhodobacter zhoushanensis]|uniref:Phospholipase D n=1 Tax=Pararhodobacter zhoushanensis TaxID=2479545 RepID=A0ABT3H3Q3_9RHOB|nr:phosphatidylserine/phosphatidylglycerophosphate/cardiolipin synthase family protein [Pararhodobacter zhoushanensis]MCW1934444.1 phosphatidylserine/phosphatidylglycerophosphate/cardiolipin synthase family protein [Pararhodobacter zhoushanensis]